MTAALTVPGQSIGQAMHRRRVLFGLPLREVAGHLGVSAQYLSDIERNRREPTEAIIRSACRVLGLPLDLMIYASGRLPDGMRVSVERANEERVERAIAAAVAAFREALGDGDGA